MILINSAQSFLIFPTGLLVLVGIFFFFLYPGRRYLEMCSELVIASATRLKRARDEEHLHKSTLLLHEPNKLSFRKAHKTIRYIKAR